MARTDHRGEALGVDAFARSEAGADRRQPESVVCELLVCDSEHEGAVYSTGIADENGAELAHQLTEALELDLRRTPHGSGRGTGRGRRVGRRGKVRLGAHGASKAITFTLDPDMKALRRAALAR